MFPREKSGKLRHSRPRAVGLGTQWQIGSGKTRTQDSLEVPVHPDF